MNERTKIVGYDEMGQPIVMVEPEMKMPTDFNVVDKLFGLNGAERYQLWPEKMARSALSLPGDVFTGKLPLETSVAAPYAIEPYSQDVVSEPNRLGFGGGSRPNPEGAIARAMDTAGFAGGATLAVKPGTASVGSGMTRKVNENPNIKMTPVDYDPFATDWYHGSVRIDRMDPKIDPKRATSGPMPFFTDDPAMASSYALGKKPDTSLQKTDPGDSVANYFTVSPKELGYSRSRTPYTVEQSWYHLKPEQKKEILEKYHKIGYKDRDAGEGPYTLHNEDYSGLSGKDHYDWVLKNEAKGNPLAALRMIWHDGGSLIGNEADLAQIYKLAGYPHKISDTNAPWVEARGVMAAKLNMKNPLVTDQKEIVMNQILPKLEEIFKNDRSRKKPYSDTDMWDKNYRYTPKEWIAQAKEDYVKGDNSYVWTSIPDKITNALKQLGFDGIIDTGGKGGGQGHKVAIPFDIPGIATSKYSGNLLYSDTGKPGAALSALAKQKAEPFYSTLERAVDNAKLDKGNADQWLGYLKNQPGVKSEELQWTLNNLPEGQITKEQLQGLVKENKIGLNETVLGNSVGLPNMKKIREWAGIDDATYAKMTEDQKDQLIKDYKKEIGFENNTQYHEYQLPGGENYKELLVSLPKEHSVEFKTLQDKIKNNKATSEDILRWDEIAPKEVNELSRNAFEAPHFGEKGKNLLYHTRVNDRFIPDDLGTTINPNFKGKPNEAPNMGFKSLHIEEIQSDWHQGGRDRGYKGEKEKLEPEFNKIEEKILASADESIMSNPDLKEALKTAVEKNILTKEEATKYERFVKIENETPVPDVPFKGNWEELALKRLIREAAEKGYDAISWTPGEAQALRYQNEIRQRLNTIEWNTDKHLAKFRKDGRTDLKRVSVDGEMGKTWVDVDKNGKIINAQHSELKDKTLDAALGKDLAKQILEKDKGNIDAKGYVMGTKGMVEAYDVRLVNKANALGKKYGAKVESKDINAKNIKKEYKIMRQNEDQNKPFAVYGDGQYLQRFATEEKANQYILGRREGEKGQANDPPQKIHYMKITPELKKKAMEEGFPLFSASPVLVPIDNDPFDSKTKKPLKITVTPIKYDPFAQ